VGSEPGAGIELARGSKIPKVTEFIYRRMGAEDAGRVGLISLAAESKNVTEREALLRTVIESARAGNRISLPENWADLKKRLTGSPANEPAQRGMAMLVTELEAFMGVPEARQAFRARLMDSSLPREQREPALALLLSVHDAEAAPLLVNLVRSGDPALIRRVVQGLGTLPHPDTPALLVEKFASFDAATQNDAVNTLATSVAGARALLAAVKAKTIPATLLSPFLARQIDAFKDDQLSAMLKDTFGDLNAPKPDLDERKKKFRPMLKPADLAKADVAKGHLIFNAICGQCHKLFGEGQNVGPDLTGSNRATLDYLLDNVLDPNAVIGKDYQLNIFELNDGRVASGVVKEESPVAYRIAMPGGLEQTIKTSEVKKRTVAKVSTMPEGLFDALPIEQLQQLVAYLQTNASPAKVEKKPAGAARKVEGALEGETIKVLHTTGGKTKVQGMAGFGGRWSNGAQLWWTGAKPGDALTLETPVERAGKYSLKAVLTKARDYGMIEVSLDDVPIEAAKMDLFNSPQVVITDELDWGTHDLSAGGHKLTIRLTGANPQAVKSYMFGLDYVKLELK
jgi:putative heme-binding domain-containing protein